MFEPQALSIPAGHGLTELEPIGAQLSAWQANANWWIGDLVIHAKQRWPDSWQQVFPETVSPGLLSRCEAVANAYPPGDRNAACTWSQHMQVCAKDDRLQRLEQIADAGQTTDQSRKDKGGRWLLAVDVNYFIHRFWHSGAGVSAADDVAKWIERTAVRLAEMGLTDVVCCFDSTRNFRKELTAHWEHKYKDRPPKDPELVGQIQIAHDRCHAKGFCCISIDGYESDDVMASYAAQFGGKVTILSQDKDLKQCLSETCNMLLDVKWNEDPTSGQMSPEYHWLTAKSHTAETGISPDQWADYQCIMGDSTDGVRGAEGIGAKGAADLIQQFGSLEAVLEAARAGDETIKEKKRAALLELAKDVDVAKQLVTMRTNLELRHDTKWNA